MDAEHALNREYAATLGIDIDRVYIAQPESGEEALSIIEVLVRSGEFSLVVLDSVDTLVPQSVIDSDMGASHPAALARLLSQALRKLTHVVSKFETSLVLINQLRKNLQMGPGAYGASELPSGGTALKYYASMRIDARRIGPVKDADDKEIGQRVRLKIVKNKLAPPMREVECDLIFGQGIDKMSDLIDLAISCKIIDKGGSWYSYGDTKLQGRISFAAWLNENPDRQAEIVSAVRIAKGLDRTEDVPEEEEDND